MSRSASGVPAERVAPRAVELAGPTRVLVLQNRFRIGGQEGQSLLHLATVDRGRWAPVVRCLRLEGEYVPDLLRLGLAPEALGIQKMARPRTLWRVAVLAAELRALGVALVHAQDFHSNNVGLVTALLAGVPCVVTRVDLGHALDPLRRQLLAAVSRAASRVVVNALCIREVCLRDGVAADRIAVVRNGVDLAAFDAASRLPPPDVPAGSPTVVQVANMHHPVKGQADLLVAMREVLRRRPEVELLLVGDGARRPMLERLAADLGVAGRVRFLGHRRDIPALLRRATVAVSASHAEGLSNAVLEAMAARRPVVGTAVGGTPELVRDGVTGLLVPPGAPAHLAHRVLTLLDDPPLARRLGEQGRALVQGEFDVETMRQSYDALYRSVLAEARGTLDRAAA